MCVWDLRERGALLNWPDREITGKGRLGEKEKGRC